jgi:hypothetical protein
MLTEPVNRVYPPAAVRAGSGRPKAAGRSGAKPRSGLDDRFESSAADYGAVVALTSLDAALLRPEAWLYPFTVK